MTSPFPPFLSADESKPLAHSLSFSLVIPVYTRRLSRCALRKPAAALHSADARLPQRRGTTRRHVEPLDMTGSVTDRPRFLVPVRMVAGEVAGRRIPSSANAMHRDLLPNPSARTRSR